MNHDLTTATSEPLHFSERLGITGAADGSDEVLRRVERQLGWPVEGARSGRHPGWCRASASVRAAAGINLAWLRDGGVFADGFKAERSDDDDVGI
jgi:hypothetical protein